MRTNILSKQKVIVKFEKKFYNFSRYDGFRIVLLIWIFHFFITLTLLIFIITLIFFLLSHLFGLCSFRCPFHQCQIYVFDPKLSMIDLIFANEFIDVAHSQCLVNVMQD